MCVYVCECVYMPQLVPSTRLLGQGWSQQGTTTLPKTHQPARRMCAHMHARTYTCAQTPLADIRTICTATYNAISQMHSYSNALLFSEKACESFSYEP